MGEVDYKAVLTDLRARRAALDQAISALETLLGESSDGIARAGQKPVPRGEMHPDSFVGLNIAEASTKYLEMVGRPARSTDEITEVLNQGGLSVSRESVATILRRVHNENGPVSKAGRGLWGLREWYHRRPNKIIKRRRERAVADTEDKTE